MDNVLARNLETLATLSTAFCAFNGLNEVNDELADELAQAICHAVNSALNDWYVDKGRVYNLFTELIEEDALRYAFGELQKLATLAHLSALAEMGMGM